MMKKFRKNEMFEFITVILLMNQQKKIARNFNKFDEKKLLTHLDENRKIIVKFES